jgi:hypothetical protein
MKLSNGELLGFFAALGSLKQRKMPARLAWKLSATEKILRPFGDAFDGATDELRKRYAEKDAKGEPVIIKDEKGVDTFDIKPDNMKKANEELADLMKETFEVQPVELTLEDFPDTLEVTPELMGLLAPMIEAASADKKARK